MKIIIIGCGIAGPVLAMLLQHLGHQPVIYERQQTTQGGVTLQLSPQTFKVLRILGLDKAAEALGKPMLKIRYTSYLSGAGEVLFEDASMGEKVQRELGWPMMWSVDRPAYARLLADSARERGIPVRFGRRCVRVSQDETGVRAMFEDGGEDAGEMLVGCDGLNSVVRDSLFGRVDPEYTGIAAVAGTSSLPPGLDATWGRQIFGQGGHMFAVRVGEDKLAWGCTIPVPEEEEVREDWRHASQEEVARLVRALPLWGWGGEPREVLGNVREAVKFGMYLRPIPESWHKGRVVLVGDAAHPTAPYLGQGANQSMEDCYHLARLLKLYAPASQPQPPDIESVERAFRAYEQLRYPRVSKAVEQATREGQSRVMCDREACARRDKMLREGFGTTSMQVVLEAVRGPYEGESEV